MTFVKAVTAKNRFGVTDIRSKISCVLDKRLPDGL